MSNNLQQQDDVDSNIITVLYDKQLFDLPPTLAKLHHITSPIASQSQTLLKLNRKSTIALTQ